MTCVSVALEFDYLGCCSLVYLKHSIPQFLGNLRSHASSYLWLMEQSRKKNQPQIGISVCMLSESYYPNMDGGAIFSRNLSQYLKKKGVRVVVISRRNLASYPSNEVIDDIHVTRVLPVSKPGFLGYLARYLAILFAAIPLITKRNQYQVIMVTNLRILGVTGVVIAKLLKKKCILRTDSFGESNGDYAIRDEKIPRVMRKIIEKYFQWRNNILRHADAFVVINNLLRREFIEAGFNANLMVQIPNGINVDIFKPLDLESRSRMRTILGLPLNKIVCTYSGRLTTEKGLAFLLRVWKQISIKHNNAHLLLIGTGKRMALSCEEELRAYVKENSLQHCVEFVGPVSSVHQYLQCSNIAFLLSETEASPLAVAEALACGVPVIATRVGGIPDTVCDGISGRLIEYGNDGELYSAIEDMLGDEGTRRRLGDNGRKAILEHLDLERISKRYIELFEGVLRVNS